MTKKQLMLSGKARDFTWILEQYKEKNLFLGSSLVTEPLLAQLRVAIRMTQEIYSDNWDLEVDVLSGNKINILSIVLNFPEIIIQNSKNKKHTIRDFYVKCSLGITTTYGSNEHKLYIQGISGNRTTWDVKEWSSDYTHSHISGIDRGGHFRSFCTGSGHINDYISQMNAGEFSEELFTRFLLQVISLVSWESIEGTPYRYLEQINHRSSMGRMFNLSPTYKKILYNQTIQLYKATKTVPVLTFKLENSRYSVVDDDKYNAFFKTENFNSGDRTRYLSFIDSSGVAWTYGQVPGRNNYENDLARMQKFVFRGEEKEFKILQGEDNNDNVTYTIHPELKNQIKEIINYEINRKAVRKSAIDRYNKTGNAIESLQSDSVLM